MRRKMIIMMAVLVMLLMSTVGAHAGYYGTDVYVNGYELTPAKLYQFEAYYGEMPPGYYLQDYYGNLTVIRYLYQQPATPPQGPNNWDVCNSMLFADTDYIPPGC